MLQIGIEDTEYTTEFFWTSIKDLLMAVVTLFLSVPLSEFWLIWFLEVLGVFLAQLDLAGFDGLVPGISVSINFPWSH